MKKPNVFAPFGFLVRSPKPHQMAQWDLYESHYAMVALCLRGSCDLEANMEHVVFSAGMRLCLPHVMLLRCNNVTDDFETMVLLIDRRTVPDALLEINTPMLSELFNPISSTINSSDDFGLLVQMMQSLQRFTEIEPIEAQSLVGQEMLRSFMRVLVGVNSRRQGKKGREIISSADNYFRRFMNLLAEEVSRHHDVAFYSDRLCISPKYLNIVCKRCSGRKAKEIINVLLLTRLKREILVSDKSLKQIAEMYAFANQSSLGKFFRNYMGVSPMTFRQYGVQVLNDSENV